MRPCREDEDAVHGAEGGEPVRDADDGAVLGKVVDGLLHLGFGLRVSSAAVASSRTRMGALRTKARAMAMRWCWPPLRRWPRSPSGVS